MAKSPNDGDQSLNPHLHTSPHEFDSPEGRAKIAEADIVIAVDPDQETRTVLYGREMLEEIAQSGIGHEAILFFVSLDTAIEKLDELERLIRAIKGSSSFHPADLFPEVEIDNASFASDPELLEAICLVVDEMVAQHRTLLPPVQLRFYYSVKTAGFTTAEEELRCAAEAANEPRGYIVPLLTFGDLLQKRLPARLIKPNHCLEIDHGVGDNGNMLRVRCRSLLVRPTARPCGRTGARDARRRGGRRRGSSRPSCHSGSPRPGTA